MHIDHVNIKATAGLLEQVREFYCQVLGLETGPRPPFGDRGYWLYHGEQALIHLTTVANDRASDSPGAFDHFALRVPDLSPFIQRLQDAGVEYKDALVPGTGLRQVFFRDPAGARVEIQGPANMP